MMGAKNVGKFSPSLRAQPTMGAFSAFDLSRTRKSFFLVCLAVCVFATLSLLRRDDGDFLRPAKWGLDNILRPQSELDIQGLDTQHPSQLEPELEPETQSQTQILDLLYLEKHKLTPSFSYSRRTIKTKSFDGKRETLTKINATLFDTPDILDVDELWNRNTTIDIPPSLTLHVPSSPQVNTSIISFGIATTALRLPDAFPNLEHWLSNTSSPLHVVVAEPEENQLSELQSQLNDLSVKATLTNTSLPFSKAYFSLIKELYDARTPETQWIVLIDDDTFIPSLPALLTHLNTAYDSSQEIVISAETENIEQIKIFGIQPFGGGGIFISVPLAAFITQPDVWDSCLRSSSPNGDHIVNKCLEAHSSVRVTYDMGLNQMDIRGDFFEPAGYFENGRQMLTIHHWRSWFDVDMPAVSTVSKVCGDEGVLMRWRFEGDVVLSNGYSIVEYPQGISDEGLKGVELTWSDQKWRYVHRIGPLRKKLGRDRKRAFGMVETVVLEEGVRQTYLERAEEDKGKVIGIDRIVELLWLFE
jgi:hypothetical protein